MPLPLLIVAHGVGLHSGQAGGISVYDLISAQARRDANAPAIFAPGRAPLDFGGLLDQIDYIRTTLNGCGLGQGDRIALLGARGPEMAVALLGIACCATCVPLNSAAPVTETRTRLWWRPEQRPCWFQRPLLPK